VAVSITTTQQEHCRASHNHICAKISLHSTAFWYDGQCNHSRRRQACTCSQGLQSFDLASQHWRLHFRDIVERTLPVLLGGQWPNLQHHSLADKLQVGLLLCYSGSALTIGCILQRSTVYCESVRQRHCSNTVHTTCILF